MVKLDGDLIMNNSNIKIEKKTIKILNVIIKLTLNVIFKLTIQ